MRTIGKAVRTAVCGTALILVALPGISAAAEPGGMGGMQHGDHTGMDVGMPTPGKYTIKADVESADKKGSATFSYAMK